jgi:putative PIN family toxin of toxin-antitoxin system
MKIVLDTNCLLVSIPKRSTYRWLWDSFRNQQFILCYTTEILEEYNEVIADFYSIELAENIINEILNSQNANPVTVFYKWQLIKNDVDDNKFVDCAISAAADLIVTNDKHFNILSEIDFPKVPVSDLLGFKNILQK